jgi:hypothetical protein
VVTETKVLYTTVCPVGGNGGAVTTQAPPPVEYTTSTVYATKIYTVTACPPSVPNCPGRGSVTTEIVPVYTTVCPVSGNSGAVPTPGLSAPANVGYTTGTVYTTKVVTVTACAPGVVNCPGTVTTATVPLYTTVYPTPSGTTTISIKTTSFYTIKVTYSVSTATIIPIQSSPVAPYPTPSSATSVRCASGYGTATGSVCYPISTATGVSTIATSIKVVEVSPVPLVPSVVGGNKAVVTPPASAVAATTTPAGTIIPAKPTSTLVQGAASKMGSGVMIALCALVMGVLVL